MKGTCDSPDTTWDSGEHKNKKVYENLATKLDDMGRLITWWQCESSDSITTKARVYLLPKGTAVELMENTRTGLNRYVINVRLEVYSTSKKTAEKKLESILG